MSVMILGLLIGCRCCKVPNNKERELGIKLFHTTLFTLSFTHKKLTN